MEGEETQFTNVFLPLTLRYKTEKDLLGFSGGFTRDNTLMSELLSTGLVLRFTQRNQWTANPSWTRSITEKLSIQSNFQLNDTTYEDGLSLGLVDYQLFGGSGGLLYQLTEQDQIQLTGSYVNFHTTNAPAPFRADFPGVNLTLTHAFTETLTGTAHGGPRFVSSTTQIVSDNIRAQSTVWLFGASLTKKFESTSIQVNVDRDIVPSGFGLLIQRDRAGLTMSHDLTETLAASFNGSGYLVSGVTERRTRRHHTGEPLLLSHTEDRLEIFGVVEAGAVLYLWAARRRRSLRFCHVQCHDVHADVLSTKTGVLELNDLFMTTQSPLQTG